MLEGVFEIQETKETQDPDKVKVFWAETRWNDELSDKLKYRMKQVRQKWAGCIQSYDQWQIMKRWFYRIRWEPTILNKSELESEGEANE